MNNLYCEYNSDATFEPAGSCITFTPNTVPKYLCSGGGCSTIGVCHPDYNSANAYTTSAACVAACTVSVTPTYALSGSGCLNSTASNYNSHPNVDRDCANVLGGSDESCCEWVVYGVYFVPPPNTQQAGACYIKEGSASGGGLAVNPGGFYGWSAPYNSSTEQDPAVRLAENICDCCAGGNGLFGTPTGIGPTVCNNCPGAGTPTTGPGTTLGFGGI
jgi:hypothetical protein